MEYGYASSSLLLPPSFSSSFSLLPSTFPSGNAPPPANLGDWIVPNTYDIYAIGVQVTSLPLCLFSAPLNIYLLYLFSFFSSFLYIQECNYTPRPGYGSCEEDWIATLQNHLGENYVKITSMSHLLRSSFLLSHRPTLTIADHSVNVTFR